MAHRVGGTGKPARPGRKPESAAGSAMDFLCGLARICRASGERGNPEYPARKRVDPEKPRPLACVSHWCSTAAAEKRTVPGRTPDGRLDVVSTTPSPSSDPCSPAQRLFDALVTNTSEIRRPAFSSAGSSDHHAL